MVRSLVYEEKENVMGGTGKVCFYHVINSEEFYGHGRLYAKVVLPSGSSIGVHQHVGETEPYLILEGEGIFTDANGDKIAVKAGDVCTILPGQTHGMANESGKDLVFMALIHKD